MLGANRSSDMLSPVGEITIKANAVTDCEKITSSLCRTNYVQGAIK
jgi:hypothetical protein